MGSPLGEDIASALIEREDIIPNLRDDVREAFLNNTLSERSFKVAKELGIIDDLIRNAAELEGLDPESLLDQENSAFNEAA